MPSAQETTFLKDSAAKAFEPRHRQIINYNIDKYDAAVQIGLTHFHHIENSKRKAHIIKWRMMENLDKLLPELNRISSKKAGRLSGQTMQMKHGKKSGKSCSAPVQRPS